MEKRKDFFDKYKDYNKYLANYLMDNTKDDIKHNFHCIVHEEETGKKDSDPSMHYYPQSNTVRCFSCGGGGQTYNLISLVMKKENLNFNDALKYIESNYFGQEEIRLSKNEEIKKGEPMPLTYFNGYKTDKTREFLKLRGFKEIDKILKYYKLCDSKKLDGIIIPHINNKQITSYTTRLLHPDNKAFRYQRAKGYEADLFNSDILDLVVTRKTYEKLPPIPIFLVEGEIDALSFYECGAVALGISSTNNLEKVTRFITSYKKELISNLKNESDNYREAKVLGFNDLIFIPAFDNDDAGKECKEEFIKIANLYNIKYADTFDYGEYKDANEFMQNNREEFINKIKETFSNTKSYLEEYDLNKYKKDAEKNGIIRIDEKNNQTYINFLQLYAYECDTNGEKLDNDNEIDVVKGYSLTNKYYSNKNEIKNLKEEFLKEYPNINNYVLKINTGYYKFPNDLSKNIEKTINGVMNNNNSLEIGFGDNRKIIGNSKYLTKYEEININGNSNILINMQKGRDKLEKNKSNENEVVLENEN